MCAAPLLTIDEYITATHVAKFTFQEKIIAFTATIVIEYTPQLNMEAWQSG